jgi:integrase/recombinase XerC
MHRLHLHMVLDQLFIAYLTTGRRLSAHTVLAYQTDLSQFMLFLSQNHALEAESEITHLHIRAWVVQLHEQSLDPKTIKRKIACLKAFFLFLSKNRYITYNPMLKVSTPKIPKRLPSVVQEKQMEQLFTYIDFGADFKGKRNRLILELLYATGIRCQELMQLKLRDILTEKSLLKVLGKGNKERLVPIPNYLRPVLDDYLAIRAETFVGTQEPTLFLTGKGTALYPKLVYDTVHKYLSLVSSAEQLSPHTLRHTFATHLSNSGADLNAIKTLLGHSSLASTQIYMHNGINRLKAVYEQAHPRSKSNGDEE